MSALQLTRPTHRFRRYVDIEYRGPHIHPEVTPGSDVEEIFGTQLIISEQGILGTQGVFLPPTIHGHIKAIHSNLNEVVSKGWGVIPG